MARNLLAEVKTQPVGRNLVAAQQAQPDPFARLAQEQGPFQTGAISMGRGLAKIGRALGLVDPESESERAAFAALETARPVATTIGEVVGESLPFAAIPVGGALGAAGGALSRVAPAAGRALAGRAATVAGTGALGATEGALITKGEGRDVGEQIFTGGIAGGAAAGLEAVSPIIGRIGGALVRRVTGRAPAGSLIDAAGQPTQELAEALAATGLEYGDLLDAGRDMLRAQAPGADPAQVARAARFAELGVPYSKGDITGDFAQQALEQRMLQSAAGPDADTFRALKLEQSRAIEGRLQSAIDRAGVPEELGTGLKEALTGRKSAMRAKKAQLYKEAAKRAENAGGLPLPTDEIYEALPDARTIRRIATLDPGVAEAFQDLVAEYGVDTSEAALERIARKGLEVTPLDIGNFDTFRMALGQIMDAAPGQPNRGAVLAGPVKDALDITVDNLSDALDLVKEVAEPLRAARATVRQMKTEFSPQAITGRLINARPDGVSPVIEASNVFKEIVGVNKPVEMLERTVQSLAKSGAAGKKALGDLQAATVFDLVNSAFKSETRKISGEKVFGPVAFVKRMDQIGDRKLGLIFADAPDALKELKRLRSIAEDITPPAGAVPKGSAAVNLDAILSVLGRLPVAGRVGSGIVNGMATLARIGSDAQALRQAVEASPDVRQALQLADRLAPAWVDGLAVGVAPLGAAATAQALQPDNRR